MSDLTIRQQYTLNLFNYLTHEEEAKILETIEDIVGIQVEVLCRERAISTIRRN